MSETQTRSPCGAAAVNARLARVLATPGATMSRLLAFLEFSASGRELVGRGLRDFQSSAPQVPDLDRPEAWAALRADMRGKSLQEKLTAAYDPARSLAERCAIVAEFIDQRELAALAAQSALQSAQPTPPPPSMPDASAVPTARKRPVAKHARRPRTDRH